jgi:glycosyltransferase involved in cell wall biosynthesis/O-antigen/teichoic acid export membrane protein
MSQPAVDTPTMDDGRARITRGAAWIILSIGLEGVLNYAYAIVATRLLSVPEYTVFAAGQALLLIVGTASGTSIPWVLSRSLARAGSNRRVRTQAVQFAIAANFAFSALAATIVWVVARSFADTSTAVLIAVAMALMFVASTVWGYLNGDQRFRTVAGTRVAEVVGKVAAGVTLMALGLGALGGLAGFAIGSGIVLAAGLIYMRADLGRPGRLAMGRPLLRATAGTTLIQGTLAVVTSADVILVAVLDIPKGQAATYQVAMLLGRVPLFVAGAVALTVFPSLAARPRAMQPLVASSMRLLRSLLVPVAMVIATIPTPLLLLVFGQEYRGVARLIPLAACTGALGGLVTMLATYLQADDRFLRAGLILLGGAVLQAAAIWSGWQVAGVIGVAWGVLLTALAIALGLLAPGIRAWPGSFRPRLSDVAGWTVAGTWLLLARGRPALWIALVTVLGLLVAWRAFSARPEPETGQPVERRRPRILHLGFEDFRRPGAGGGSARTHEINRRLASAFDVTVVTAKFPGWQDRLEDGVRYVHVGLDLGYFPSLITYFLVLPRAVRRFDHDLVVEDFGAPISSALVPLYAKAPCVAVVQWLWAREKAHQYHLPFHWFERAGVRLHDRMITPSDDLAGTLRAANSAAEVHVIPNGVDAASFDVVQPRRPVALFLGRLETEQKGLDVLLDAFAKVADQTTARLEIAGDGRDRAALEARCRRLGIADRVDFLGRVDGPAKLALLASAQLVCMPSRRETFGMVAAEALACGTPVLAADIDNLRHLVRPGTGRLVTAGDPTAYAVVLLELLRSPQACWELGARGRGFARGFDWDCIAGQQELVYRRALVLTGNRLRRSLSKDDMRSSL